MFIDDLLIGVILCGLVMSVVYLRVDLLGSRRQKTASHAVHELAACKREIAAQNATLRSAEIKEGHRKVRAGTQRRLDARGRLGAGAPREEGQQGVM